MIRLFSILFYCLISCSAFAEDVVYYVARDNAKLLQSHDEASATLGLLPKGTEVDVTGSTFAYFGVYNVEVQGVRGYMRIEDLSDEYIKRTDNSKIIVSQEPAYRAVRPTRLQQSFDENSATVAKIDQGATVQITGSTFAYFGVFNAKYDGKSGYVLTRDVEFVNQAGSAKSTPVKVMPPTKDENFEDDNEEIAEEFDEEFDLSGIRSMWHYLTSFLYLILLVLGLLVFWSIFKLCQKGGYDEECGVKPSSHILLSIVTFIFFSRILGGIAFIFSLIASDRWNRGEIDGAYSASNLSKKLCYIAILIVSSFFLLVSLTSVMFASYIL